MFRPPLIKQASGFQDHILKVHLSRGPQLGLVSIENLPKHLCEDASTLRLGSFRRSLLHSRFVDFVRFRLLQEAFQKRNVVWRSYCIELRKNLLKIDGTELLASLL